MSLQAVTLNGRHVRLEPLAEAHREALRPVAQDPAIWTFTTSALGTNFDPWFDRALGERAAGRELPFAVRLLRDDSLVGSTRYMSIEAAHKRLEVGATWYARAVWASAVNPECKLLLMHHVFETLGWHRVEYKTDLRNQRSRDAIARLGALQEGIFRRHMILADGHVRDSVYFSVVDGDWPAVKAGLEKRLRA
ncbi:MAG: GNAT family N-acetyltransferase [Alphaproteobacteria bacterium]|nr:GNAT family N-acetyltransferase [Alphaproteobacteria bacterium]